MAASRDAAARARSRDPAPVEGESEIDISLSGAGFLVFAEAKLGSDVSTRTTHDPSRNQLVRTIDCVLEAAGGRAALVWLLLRSRGPGLAAIQLLERYRADPGAAAGLLPHRDAGRVAAVTARLAVITWADLLPLVAGVAGDDERATLQEVQRRVS